MTFGNSSVGVSSTPRRAVMVQSDYSRRGRVQTAGGPGTRKERERPERDEPVGRLKKF